jgi:hypothetical protein
MFMPLLPYVRDSTNGKGEVRWQSYAGAPRSALRARGPYPASSAGVRAADSARPGGHHDPSSFDPAGTVMASSDPLSVHPRLPRSRDVGPSLGCPLCVPSVES